MIHSGMKVRTGCAAAAASAIILLTSCSAGRGDLRFFSGKQVTIIVPYGLGGGTDAYARAVAPFLQKNLPGSQVTVRNVTTSGGVDGKNLVYEARPDGLTVGFMPGSGALLAEWAGGPGIRYRTERFSWIGRLNAEAHVLAASPRSGLAGPADFTAGRMVRIGFAGTGSDDYTVALAAAKVLGWAVDPRTSYLSSDDAGLACVRGEVDAVLFSVSSLMPQIRARTLVPIITFGASRVPGLPGVPTVFEAAPPDAQRVLKLLVQVYALDRTLIGPPGLPAGRLSALRAALDAAAADPEFLANMAKLGRPVTYLTGEQTTRLIDGIRAGGDDLRRLVREAVGAQRSP
jgi:tripartite-type tricarboxylate transporter receptor subunit TctC